MKGCMSNNTPGFSITPDVPAIRLRMQACAGGCGETFDTLPNKGHSTNAKPVYLLSAFCANDYDYH